MCVRFVPSWKSSSPTNRELSLRAARFCSFTCSYWRPSLNYGSALTSNFGGTFRFSILDWNSKSISKDRLQNFLFMDSAPQSKIENLKSKIQNCFI
jgi:hypothetical protein